MTLRTLKSGSLAALLLGGAVLAAEPGAAPSEAAPSGAAPSAPTTRPASQQAASPAEIETLLADLSNPNFRVRDRATARLSELGSVIEQRLRQFAAEATNPEARTRARSLLSQIEIRTRQQAGTPVTVKVTDQSPATVFGQISLQSGLSVVPRSPSLFEDRTFSKESFELVDVPFWVAVKEACRRWNLRPQYEGGDGGSAPRVVLISDLTGEMASPHVLAGPAMVVVTNSRKRTSETPGKADLDLMLTFFMDPKWRVVEYPSAAKISPPAGPTGDNLGQAGNLSVQPFREGSGIWSMRGSLPGVPEDLKVISKLTGEASLKVLEVAEPVSLDNPVGKAGVVLKTKGGHSLHVVNVTRAGEQYRVRAVLIRNNLAETSWRRTAEMDCIQLVDAKGRPLTRIQQNIDGEDPQLTIDLTFLSSDPSPGAPARLIWRMPMDERDLRLAFRFNDLSLSN